MAPGELWAALPSHGEQQTSVPDEAAESSPGSYTPLPELHSNRQPTVDEICAGQDAQQKVYPQGTPQHSGWAQQYPDGPQVPHIITGSGRKRARPSISSASSSSAGEQAADISHALQQAPLPASAPQSQHTGALQQTYCSKDGEEAPSASVWRTVAAGGLGEASSPGSSATDELASPPVELDRQAALVAAKAVAQVMGLQARHHVDMLVCSCSYDYQLRVPCRP